MACARCILVVDEDPAVREAMRDFIDSVGCSCVVAANADEARLCLKFAPPPCFVLVDAQVVAPPGQGAAVACHVQPGGSIGGLPVVAVPAAAAGLGARSSDRAAGAPPAVALEPALRQFCVARLER